jgi:predicted HicB family RNase H-like nuclease
MMTYKDYLADVQFDDETGIFHGEVVNTHDVITFQGASIKELRKAFKDSIEDYLAFCKERGEDRINLLRTVCPACIPGNSEQVHIVMPA